MPEYGFFLWHRNTGVRENLSSGIFYVLRNIMLSLNVTIKSIDAYKMISR